MEEVSRALLGGEGDWSEGEGDLSGQYSINAADGGSTAKFPPLLEVPASSLVGAQSVEVSQGTLSAIATQLECILDNTRDHIFVAPASRLKKERANDVIKVKAPRFEEELQGLAGGVLSAQQLASVKETATFEVTSPSYPGTPHVWELNALLQKGRVATRETFYDGMAVAAAFFVVFIPERLWRRDARCNLVDGVVNSVTALLNLPTIFIGWVERTTIVPNGDEIRKRLLLENLFGWATEEKWKEFTCTDWQDTIPLSLTTKDAQIISLRLCCQSPVREQVAWRPFEAEWKKATAQRRRALMKEFSLLYCNGELRQQVADQEARVLQERVLQLIHQDVGEEAHAKEFCDLLLAISAVRERFRGRHDSRKQALKQFQEQLASEHCILSRVDDWVTRKTNNFLSAWEEMNPEQGTLNELLNILPRQEAYLLGKNMQLFEAVAARVKRETTQRANRDFEWPFRIWSPHRWKITKEDGHQPGTFFYRVEKNLVRRTSSFFPFWRLAHIAVRFALYWNNGLFFLLANFIYGPFGFRSLVGLADFQPDKTVDSPTGQLISTGPTFATLFGRIANLWRAISESRVAFEAEPDRGFLGKGFVRPFNWTWNYLGKGVIGTLLGFGGHFLIFLANTLLSLAALLTSPLWSLLGAVSVFLFSVAIYDVDQSAAVDVTPWFPLPRLVVWDFALRGVAQSLGGLGGAVLGLLGGTAMSVWSCVRWGARRLWDKLMFGLVIRRRARVPEHNGFIIRRVSGPGLGASEYYQCIHASTALVMIQYQLELMEIELYRAQQQQLIEAPLGALRLFYSHFANVGLTFDPHGRKMTEMQKTADILKTTLSKMLSAHMDSLVFKSALNSSRIRLTRDHLAESLESGTALVEQFCKEVLVKYDGFVMNQVGWWNNKALVTGDYRGLCEWLLTKGFTAAILQPIEETTGLRIDIDHITSRKYAEMLLKGTRAAVTRDDLSVIAEVREVPLPVQGFPEPRVVVATPWNMCASTSKWEDYITLKRLQ